MLKEKENRRLTLAVQSRGNRRMQPQLFNINRRRFLKSAAAIAAAAGVPAWWVEMEQAQAAEAKKVSANDRPGIALIGCGGQGRGDCGAAQRFGDVVAVCDVDDRHAEAAAKQFTKDGKGPQKYNDFRKLMERDDVHVIINGTPDHWHTLVNILAARTGKDIYSEKPLTLTIDEGKRLVKEVRKAKRILQVGSQQRSDRNFRVACEMVRNGRIGKLQHMVVGLPTGPVGGPFPEQPVPKELNWDYYLGQAKFMPYNGKNAHWDFRWWYAFSGGQMTDWGAHHNDIARWAIGADGPISIEARETVGPIAGGFNTCKEFEATLIWPGDVKQIIRTTTADNPFGGIIDPNGQRNGIRFTGSDGWLWVNRQDMQASKDEIFTTPLPDNAPKLEVSADHMKNFFDCVKSRKDPIARVEEGHRSANVGHLVIIAMQLGRKLQWDAKNEVFTGDGAKEANTHLAREMRKPYDYSFVGA